MARFNKGNSFLKKTNDTVVYNDEVINEIALSLDLSKAKVSTALRGLGISSHEKLDPENLELFKELVCCKYGILKPFVIEDENFKLQLDNQIKGFDEIYIDTAPLIHKDWFMYFIANIAPVLRRRRQKLVILEKTMEELHGLKNNDEKDQEVRLRAMIRPVLIRTLAKKGLVKVMDTGSTGIADDHLIDLFRRRGKSKDILLITQDRELSERVVLLQEELNKNIEIPHYTFFQRLRYRNTINEDIKRKAIACKLLEGGTLLRLYICPRCLDSYYDKIVDCEGYVICSSCYYDLKEEERLEELEEQKIKQKKQIEEEKKKDELLRILEEKETLKNQTSVGKRLKRRILIIRGITAIILLFIIILGYKYI
jgi:uncharacterized Zn finger protein (UPF0148 family)/rRNA-processing protein FCF1